MIYGFSLLFVLLALVTGVPALRQMLAMRKINRNCATTSGEVVSDKSMLGWLWTSSFGRVSRSQVRYYPPQGEEMILVVHASSMFTFHRYEPHANVEVVYDRDRPGRAYAKPEWEVAKGELRIATASLLVAIVLWIAGLILHLPL
jgi:hypothetical protein